MSPKKVQLPKDTTAITVYIKKAILADVDERRGPIARNKVAIALFKGYAEGTIVIDWRK